MSTPPRVFVGTLFSGEAEFDESQSMIRRQEGVAVETHVTSGLPELEAHNALWAAWEAAKKRHDLFVKIDADTILVDEGALSRIHGLFAGDPDVTGAQIL